MPAERIGRRAANVTRPMCRICERRIHVPRGWSPGAATRRHYWAKHREVMLKSAR